MTETDLIATAKAKLRTRCRSFRASLSVSEYERRSALICEEAKLLPEIQQADTIHLYWPIVEMREVDTRPLVPWLEEKRKTIILPKVTSFDRESGMGDRLRHVRFPGESKLVVNRWGIAEPPPGEDVNVGMLDVVIVPALGAGRNGHRIGHGHGFYDEFLAATAAPKIALVYDECLVERIPHQPHDVPVDVVISEREVIRISFV